MSNERPSWQNKDEEEEDEEEEVDENAYIAQKDAVLFAIEISASMISIPPSHGKEAEESPASAALKCAYRIMQDRIISNPKDMMGILLFGTEKSKFQEEDETSRGGLSFPHCYLLADLDVPDAATVKLIKKLIEDEDRTEAEDLLKPSDEPVSMSSMFFCANQAFTTKAPNFGSRRLFVITDNDNPHADDKASRNTAAVRAKDLYDLGVIVELFPISRLDHEFDRALFYDDVLYADPNPDAISVPSATLKPALMNDGLTLLTSLISSVKSKQTPKRALFSKLKFEIGPKLQISVKGYNVIDRQKPARTSWIWEDGEKSQIAEPVSSKMLDAREFKTDEEIKKVKDLTQKVYKFGGTQIGFKEDELKSLKDFGEAIIRIIGFKPQKMLPIWAAMRKSTFIYPSEDEFVGSTRVFAALHQKLLKDELMGLAWAKIRKNASPAIVAILPSTELVSKNGQQIHPAGLWLYPLPFADDLRPLPSLKEPIKVEDYDNSLISQIGKAIKQLQLPGAHFDPTLYPNPALQWHYKIIQAMALDEELPEHTKDMTLPRYKQIDKRAASYLAEWNQTLEEQHRIYAKNRSDSEQPTKKRAAADTTAAANKKAKKEKLEGEGPKYSVDDMKILFQQNKVATCTAVDLKSWLKHQGLTNTGLKADLVTRVEEYFEEKEA